MSFQQGIVGGEEVSEAPFSHNFADFFSSWQRERVNDKILPSAKRKITISTLHYYFLASDLAIMPSPLSRSHQAATSVAKLAAAANAALLPSCRLCCQAGRHRTLTKLPPPSWLPPPHCCRTSAAAAISFVFIVIVVAVIVAVTFAASSQLLIVCAPAIAVTANVFIATVAARSGSTVC